MKMSNTNTEPCGVLVVDKPAGMTSHDAVNKIRRLYNTKKVGHTGTLDPMATGVLVILIGRAAKAAEYIVSDSKRYTAGLLLGLSTDTLDTTGSVTQESDNIPDKERVLAILSLFRGAQKQVPPMYSAIKKDGVKMVDLARRGIEIELPARDIEIYELTGSPTSEKEYSLEVYCSKGTYIRSLCRDIGDKLGCGGVMSSLRRTASGAFDLSRSHTFDELEAMEYQERLGLLFDIESLFADCPKVVLPDFFAHLAHSGAHIYQKKIGASFEDGRKIRLADKNGFFALGQVTRDSDGESVIKPIKQFVL